jgi:hypothetical protein
LKHIIEGLLLDGAPLAQQLYGTPYQLGRWRSLARGRFVQPGLIALSE